MECLTSKYAAMKLLSFYIDKIHFPLRPQHTGQYSIRPNAETDGNRGGI